jgi:SAM-dependent methyltransferase
MLDAGTGDGGAMTLRDWPEPGRPDIKMFARAGDSSPGFSNHTGSEIGWWPAEPPQFGGKKFDAIFCCNFIEHIDEPLTFIARAIDTLAPNGRIFLEWPKPESISLPTTGDLASFGVSVTTCAYHDDRTHREAPPPPSLSEVISTLQERGFRILEQGISSVPFIDRQVAIHARQQSDLTAMTLAYWSYTGWCQFVSAEHL